LSVRVKIIGRDRLNAKFRRLPVDQVTGVGRAVALSALEVQGEARKSIQRGRRTGVIVRKGGKRHQRSAPGEPPKTDTGRLVSNIFAILDANQLGAEIGTDIRYGRHLEFGTRKMQPRPWLHPAFERMKPRIAKRFAKFFKDANRKSGR